MDNIKNLCADIESNADIYGAAKAYLQCDEGESERIIKSLLKDEAEETAKVYAQELLLTILFWQGRYSEIEQLEFLPKEKMNLALSLIGFYSQHVFRVDGGAMTADMPDITEGLPAIPVKINGVDLTLLFDTGSTITVLSNEVAKKCGLLSGGDNIFEGQNAAGDILNPTPATVKEIKICSIEITNKLCLVLPSQMMEFGKDSKGKPRKIDGTLGWDIIKDFKWTVDFKNRKITAEISKPENVNNVIKNMCCDFFPMINFFHDKKNKCFGLDTGANKTVFRKSMTEESIVADAVKSEITVYSSGNAQTAEGLTIKEEEFCINNSYIKIKDISLREELHNNTNNFILPGVFGSDIAFDKSIVIDFPNRFCSVDI